MGYSEHRAVLDEIARRAPHYTPEWSFSPDAGNAADAGAALAKIWADMFCGTLERFRHLPDNYHRALLDTLGSQPREAGKAVGWLAFDIRPEAGDIRIPKATAAATASDPDVVLESDRELIASDAKITDIYCVRPALDSVEHFNLPTDVHLFRSTDAGEHVWTFTHDCAFDISRRGALLLVPELAGSDAETLASARWECRDSRQWLPMKVTTESGALRCCLPNECHGPVKVLRLTVSRSQVGDLVLTGLTAKPSGRGLPADALYSDSVQQPEEFQPFGHRFLPGNSVYFANTEALQKPGAEIKLSFYLDYQKAEIEGWSETEIRMKSLMKASDFVPPKEYEITADEVKWEYFNGVGWAALEVYSHQDIFNGKAQGQVGISFICPHDLKPAAVGAHDLPFIRARLTAAGNLFRQRGYYLSPRLSNVRFAYRYRDGLPVTCAEVRRHLEQTRQSFPLRLAAHPAGPQAVYFASDREFTQGAILISIASVGTMPPGNWEYFAQEGWRALEVRDETIGLQKTGVLIYQASAAQKIRLWGKEAYWLRLAVGGEVERGPHLLGLYENAVPATARNGGGGANLPANSFVTPTVRLPGVEGVTNPLPTYGGTDIEDDGSIISRLSAELSHCGRAITAGDCEALALEASPRVFRARYLPRTDEAGCDAAGQACLVLLPHEADIGFDSLRSEVSAYILPRRPLSSERLSIVPPTYISVNVSARLIPERPEDAFIVKGRIMDALAEYLSPYRWQIGQLPLASQIEAIVYAVNGVLSVGKLEVLFATLQGGPIALNRIAGHPLFLPVNGSHDILFE